MSECTQSEPRFFLTAGNTQGSYQDQCALIFHLHIWSAMIQCVIWLLQVQLIQKVSTLSALRISACQSSQGPFICMCWKCAVWLHLVCQLDAHGSHASLTTGSCCLFHQSAWIAPHVMCPHLNTCAPDDHSVICTFICHSMLQVLLDASAADKRWPKLQKRNKSTQMDEMMDLTEMC